MHVASYKKPKKTTPSDTPNKNDIQKKKHPLMTFKNDGTLRKWHMTNTPPKKDKCDTHKKLKNSALQKWHTLRKMPKGHLQ